MKNKSGFIFLTIILSLLVIYSFITNVVLPVMTKNPIPATVNVQKKDLNQKKEASGQKKSTGKNSAVVDNEEPVPESLKTGSRRQAKLKLLELRKAEKFLESKLKLVKEDSMYLVLDLEKQTAVIELKGVPLHESHFLRSKVSSTIKNQPAETLLNWIAEPFTLKEDSATIPKIVYIEKIAPKDTTEANQAETLPEPPKRGDVYVVMDYERNLRLIIRQDEKPDKEGRKSISSLRWKYMKDDITKSLNALVTFKRDPAIPTIEIILPKSEATILYRALPYKPKLLLKL